jgi:hypothetical protein
MSVMAMETLTDLGTGISLQVVALMFRSATPPYIDTAGKARGPRRKVVLYPFGDRVAGSGAGEGFSWFGRVS